MKDLDFDELDRAVNSLMSNVPKSAPQTTTTNEKTLDLGSSLHGDSQAIPAKLEDMAKKAAEQDAAAIPTSSTSAPASPTVVTMPRPSAPAVKAPDRPQSSAPAIRRGGRFMDVVHPSSDMKKPETPRSVSRQGVTIEPMGKAAPGEPVVQAKPFAPAPVMPEAETKPVDKPEMSDEALKPLEPPQIETTIKPADTSEPATSSSDWPDPLDMVTKNDAAAPLTSPFLADAKVEKRPLGSPVTPEMMDDDKKSDSPVSTAPETTSEKETAELPEPTEEPEAKKEPELPVSDTAPVSSPKLSGTEEMTAPLPEELQGDLMAVEADTTHDEIKQKHDTATQQEQPAVHENVSDAKAPRPEPKSEPTVAAGPTSIAQQYHEEPSTGDQDNGAIYDTSTYHQPLAHPAKKKPGWLWVVWIVVILLLGAAGGAAIYFFKLV